MARRGAALVAPMMAALLAGTPPAGWAAEGGRIVDAEPVEPAQTVVAGAAVRVRGMTAGQFFFPYKDGYRCYMADSGNGNGLFTPYNTEAEWSAFQTAAPRLSVGVSRCCAARQVSLCGTDLTLPPTRAGRAVTAEAPARIEAGARYQADCQNAAGYWVPQTFTAVDGEWMAGPPHANPGNVWFTRWTIGGGSGSVTAAYTCAGHDWVPPATLPACDGGTGGTVTFLEGVNCHRDSGVMPSEWYAGRGGFNHPVCRASAASTAWSYGNSYNLGAFTWLRTCTNLRRL